MNSDYDKRLEAEVAREMQGLHELQAPASLIPRVLRAVEQPAALPWYRQPWTMWPSGWRVASFGSLLTVFAGLCIAGWWLSRASSLTLSIHGLGGRWADFMVAWDTLRVLAESGVLIMKKLGTGFIIACLVVAAFSYFACVGLGTLFYRYALARR